jgi:hypothetical protein
MSDALIGGAIAAVIGGIAYAIVGLLLERRHERAQKLAIVEALIIETAENLAIYENFTKQKGWWLRPYVVDAYRAYKGHLFFLDKRVRGNIIGAALAMEVCNNVVHRALLRKDAESVGKSPIPRQKELIEQLKSINEELQKWRDEHTR